MQGKERISCDEVISAPLHSSIQPPLHLLFLSSCLQVQLGDEVISAPLHSSIQPPPHLLFLSSCLQVQLGDEVITAPGNSTMFFTDMHRMLRYR
jgi:hypothetical protein